MAGKLPYITTQACASFILLLQHTGEPLRIWQREGTESKKHNSVNAMSKAVHGREAFILFELVENLACVMCESTY